MSNLRIACLQMLPVLEEHKNPWDKAWEWCRKAAERGADIALFPELWNTGYKQVDLECTEVARHWKAQALSLQSSELKRFQHLAKELEMAIAVTYLEEWNPKPRNTMTLFDRHGREVLTYAKVHTCDFAPMEWAMTPGDGFKTATLDTRVGNVTVGAMICFDREFPESARVLMLQGAEVVLVPNACRLENVRLSQFLARSFENSMALVMTNYPAPWHNGHSSAVFPDGRWLLQAGELEELLVVDIPLEELRDWRETEVWGNAFRKPHRYSTLVEEKVAPVFRRINLDGKPWKSTER